MEIINLIENTSIRNSIKCEHGLSLYIKIDNKHVLFDLGQSDKLISNANELGVDLKDIDYVILSHGHYDHTGGLPAFLSINTKAKVLMHQSALSERFSKSRKIVKANGISWRQDWQHYKDRIQFINTSFELFSDFWVISNIQRDLQLCPLDRRLIQIHGQAHIPDHFKDELVVCINSLKGPLVITGCAHNGIVNILKTLDKQLDHTQFHYIIGGLHLMGKDVEQIAQLSNQLKDFQIDNWALNHCTGSNAIEALKEIYPNKVNSFKGGESINIPEV